MKTSNVIGLIAVAGIGYVAYKFWEQLQKPKSYVEDVAAKTYLSLEDLITGYTPVQGTLAGAVVFPNGARVPMSNLSVKPYNGPQGFEARVIYQGITYRLAPHDANGNYQATRV